MLRIACFDDSSILTIFSDYDQDLQALAEGHTLKEFVTLRYGAYKVEKKIEICGHHCSRT